MATPFSTLRGRAREDKQPAKECKQKPPRKTKRGERAGLQQLHEKEDDFQSI